MTSTFIQVFYFIDWIKHQLDDPKLFQAFLKITVTGVVGAGALALGGLAIFYSLLDPTYAKDHIPSIASISEHQPITWSSFMFDFHILLFFFPARLYFYFKRLTDSIIFIVLYSLTSLYFAGVMVHLILVATPTVYLINAIAISTSMKNLAALIHNKYKSPSTGVTKRLSNLKASVKVSLNQALTFQRKGASVLLFGVLYLLTSYVTHYTWVTSEAYSSPSIILAARGAHGDRVIFDDYREAYFWLR